MFIYDKDYFYKNILRYDENVVYDIAEDKEEYYNEFEIPKHSGTRTIRAINPTCLLYRMQKNLKINFFDNINMPVPVKGFIKGENYVSYLTQHVGKKYYLRMDIHAFFDSITTEQIQDVLSEFIQNKDVIACILEIVTLDKSLPQGAITSPSISNIVFRRIDQRILKYCQETNVTYTRYADDLLFSSNDINFTEDRYFYSMIKHILKSNGFESNCNKKKTGESSINLSGFVVGENVHLSRKKLKNINTLLYYFRKKKDFSGSKYRVDSSLIGGDDWLDNINALGITRNGVPVVFNTSVSLINYLCGYRAFLLSVIKNDDCLRQRHNPLKNKIKNIERIIDVIVNKEKQTW